VVGLLNSAAYGVAVGPVLFLQYENEKSHTFVLSSRVQNAVLMPLVLEFRVTSFAYVCFVIQFRPGCFCICC
jgi:hypothetical protein